MYTISNIQVSEGTVTEPVSLVDVKAWLEIDFSEKDTLLTGMNKGARKTVESILNLHLVEKTITLDIETTRDEVIPLPFTQAVSALVVKELDSSNTETTLTLGAGYYLRGNNLRLSGCKRVAVSYKSVPVIVEDIKEAIKMEVAERYANRGENSGEVSKSALEKLHPHIVQWL